MPLLHVFAPVTEQFPNVNGQLMLVGPQFNVPLQPLLQFPHSFPKLEHVAGVHPPPPGGGDGTVNSPIE